MAKKMTKALAAALLEVKREELAEAKERAQHGATWDGMPRPAWARKLLKRAHERVAEEDAKAEIAKVRAAKRVEKLTAECAALTKAAK